VQLPARTTSLCKDAVWSSKCFDLRLELRIFLLIRIFEKRYHYGNSVSMYVCSCAAVCQVEILIVTL
jgi:hypothetical protein